MHFYFNKLTNLLFVFYVLIWIFYIHMYDKYMVNICDNMIFIASSVVVVLSLCVLIRGLCVYLAGGSPMPYNKSWLLVIAHPDDESMFFGAFLCRYKDCVIVVCTDGSKGGCKKKREKEMKEVCNELGVALYLVNVEDGCLSATEKVISEIEKIYKETNRTEIVTFDRAGVSGHKDHKECYYICLRVAKRVYLRSIYVLHSVSMIEKYSFLVLMRKDKFYVKVSSVYEAIKTRKRMMYHQSQLKWFRYLYIIFSVYMDINLFYIENVY